MATVTYNTCFKNAQDLYQSTKLGLDKEITTLEKNTLSLNEAATKNTTEKLSELKNLNASMVKYYTSVESSVAGVREKGLKTIEELQKSLGYLNETGVLSEKHIEHLERHGSKKEKLVEKEKILVDQKAELGLNIKTLEGLVQKIDSLPKPFTLALNNALYVQGELEQTNTYYDRANSLYSYTYLNKALNAIQDPAEKVLNFQVPTYAEILQGSQPAIAK